MISKTGQTLKRADEEEIEESSLVESGDNNKTYYSSEGQLLCCMPSIWVYQTSFSTNLWRKSGYLKFLCHSIPSVAISTLISSQPSSQHHTNVLLHPQQTTLHLRLPPARPAVQSCAVIPVDEPCEPESNHPSLRHKNPRSRCGPAILSSLCCSAWSRRNNREGSIQPRHPSLSTTAGGRCEE